MPAGGAGTGVGWACAVTTPHSSSISIPPRFYRKLTDVCGLSLNHNVVSTPSTATTPPGSGGGVVHPTPQG